MDYHLEDSQDLGKANIAFNQCYKHAISQTEFETGGYFYLSEDSVLQFRSCINQNSYDKNYFHFNDKQFYQDYISNRIICLFHTHIDNEVSPSDLDIATSESLQLPFYIFSPKSKQSYLFYPHNYKPKPLNGRLFIPLFQDCITYIKDYLILNFKINLNVNKINWSRPKLNPNEYLINCLNSHFKEVDHQYFQNGDVVVFPETISKYFHLGIVDENQYIFHHPVHVFPKKELMNESLLNKVYKIYRHKEL